MDEHQWLRSNEDQERRHRERMDLDRERMDLDRERLQFEREKMVEERQRFREQQAMETRKVMALENVTAASQRNQN